MAQSNQVQLVVTVDVDNANKSIKSVNASLSGMEAAAAKGAQAASNGIDHMTASMIKGATAGNLIADSVQRMVGWLKEGTVEVAKYAARTEVLGVVTNQLAKVNGYSAQHMSILVDQIKALGITTQEAHGVVQKMIFAQLDLGKATQLARVAQDAAVIAGENSSEALNNIILGITTGQTRLLHNMGLQVSLLGVEAEAAKKLGHALSDHEKREAMLNAVLEEGAKIRGSYEAAMEKVGKQITSLPRYFAEAKNAIGEQFLGAMRGVVDGLKELAIWLKDNATFVADFAKGLAVLVGGGILVLLTQKVIGLAGAIQGLAVAAAANPIGLVVAGVAAGAAVLYSEWRRMDAPFRNMNQAFDSWITKQITGAKTAADIQRATDLLSKAYKDGAIDVKGYAQAQDMLADAQERLWGGLENWSKRHGIKLDTSKLQIGPPKEENTDAADALRKEITKQQRSTEQYFRDQAAMAGKSGFVKDVADINTELARRSQITDSQGVTHFVALTKGAWNAVIQDFQAKWDAVKEKLLKDQREMAADAMKRLDDEHKSWIAYENQRFQQRLTNDAEIARRNYDYVSQVYQIEQEQAGAARDRQLRSVEGADAQTIQQKVAVEQRKADIEVEYIKKTSDLKLKLFDMETTRELMEEELTMKRLGYQADEIKARLAELSGQRDTIRKATQEGGDEAVQAARENAAKQQAEMIRDHYRSVFESLKQQAGGVFDALLSKSQSVWQAIANSFKTAILTAIKDVVTSRVAAMLMQMFTGARVSFAGGASGSGGGLLGLGGLLGMGATPVLAGGGAEGALFGSGPMGGNPLVLSAFGGGGGAAVGGMAPAGSGGLGGFSRLGMLASLKNTASGFKGMLTSLGNLGYGPKGGDFGGEVAGSYRGVGGWQGGAMLAGGGILAMDGLRRGGWAGVGETAAGGALIGAKFGGPLGAVIGGIIGFGAGIARLFVKSATEKVREKVKALYGVDISDKKILQQIVDIAKQSFGNNLDMAVRSQQVRDLVQLYAQTMGQKTSLTALTPHAASLIEAGGQLYQGAVFDNGQAYTYASSLRTYGGISSGLLPTASPNAGTTIVLNPQQTVDLWRTGTTQAMAGNPRLVAASALAGSQMSASRTGNLINTLSPSVITQ